jgi:nucleoid-associated protein YejK
LIIKKYKNAKHKISDCQYNKNNKRKILIYKIKHIKRKFTLDCDVPKTESTLKPIMINNYIKAAEAAKIGMEINLVNETVYWDSVEANC